MRSYQFYLDSLLFPVAPEKLTIKIANKNKTIDLINGDVAGIIKRAGLSKITFSCLLPSTQYPFALYPSGFQPPQVYLNKLDSLKTGLKPFLFHVLRDGNYQTSFTVSLEDYDIVEDAKNHGRDVYVSITLQQYKASCTKTIQFKTDSKGSTTATVSQPSRDTTGKKTTTSYTVKRGDTLWNIAKKYLGSGAKWKTIYNANKSTIEAAAKKMGRASSSNGHWIYPGTVLVIPSSGTTGGTTSKPQTTPAKATAAVGSYQKLYTSSDATVCAKIMYNEGRGLKSKTELACIVWTILNRVDAGYGSTIQKVALAKNQFAYTAGAKTTSDYGYDLIAQAKAAVDRGDLVIACMGRGLWTSSGHFVLVWKIQGNVIYINDPASTRDVRTQGDYALFKSQVKYYFVVERPATQPKPTEPKKEEDEEMDVEKFLSQLTPEMCYSIMAEAMAYAASLPEPEWSQTEGAWKKATEKGLVNGLAPEGYVKRDELAAVLDRGGVL